MKNINSNIFLEQYTQVKNSILKIKLSKAIFQMNKYERNIKYCNNFNDMKYLLILNAKKMNKLECI